MSIKRGQLGLIIMRICRVAEGSCINTETLKFHFLYNPHAGSGVPMKSSLVFCSVTLAFLLAVLAQQRPDARTQPEQQHAKMVLIPADAFEMGSTDAEAGSDEQPVHTVYLAMTQRDVDTDEK